MKLAPLTRLVCLIMASLSCLISALSFVGAASAAAFVGSVGPNVLVRPSDSPATNSDIHLTVAGGEFESAQVVIRTDNAQLRGVTAKVVGGLTSTLGDTIPAAAITLYRVGYVDLKGFPSDGDLGGALGRFPDPLIPDVDTIWNEKRNAFPFDIPENENRIVWLDLLVPSGTKSGLYQGSTLEVRDSNNTLLASLALKVTVEDMDIPSTTTLNGGFDLNSNQICKAHNCANYPGGQTALLNAYDRIALDNRLTIAKPPTATPSSTTDNSYLTYTKPLIKGTASTRLRGASLKTITIYQWAKDSADEWRKISSADGFEDKVRFHCDEISRSSTAWTNCKNDWVYANNLWKNALPNGHDLPLEVTASIEDVNWAKSNGFTDIANRISILIPVINYLHPKDGSVFPGKRSLYTNWDSGTTVGGAQKELWGYTSCMSMGCSPTAADNHSLWSGWPSYGVDQPATQARAMGWISYLYDLKGEYYYETARDLPTAWGNLWSNDGGNHGDGTFFYPGTASAIGGTHDTPIESIRLKRVRDGREDYELLLAAEKYTKSSPQIVAIARKAFASAQQTDITQKNIDDVRQELFNIASGKSPRVDWPDYTTPPPPSTPPQEQDTTSEIASEIDTKKLEPKIQLRSVITSIPAAQPLTTKPPTKKRNSYCKGKRATIVGTNGDDVIRGTKGRDVIVALSGNDKIIGLGGGDIICTGKGTTKVNSSGGSRKKRDLIICGASKDSIIYDSRDKLQGKCERKTKRR